MRETPPSTPGYHILKRPQYAPSHPPETCYNSGHGIYWFSRSLPWSEKVLRAAAGIGRQDGLRIRWGNPWEFESPAAHHLAPRHASGQRTGGVLTYPAFAMSICETPPGLRPPSPMRGGFPDPLGDDSAGANLVPLFPWGRG